MKPILLTIAGLLAVVSVIRFIMITMMIWTEVLTLSKVFSLTWMPSLGLLISGAIVGYYTNQKKK